MMILTDRGLAVLENGGWKLHRGPSGKQFFDLVETSDGDLWLGCNGGIARFDGNRFHDYSYYDGVALSECNTGAALQDSRGVIWLGGVDVSVVFPGLMRRPPQAIPIVTRVSVDGQEKNLRDTLEVLSSVRRLDIRFAAPSFWNEQEQSFRYRLEGLETQWSVPGGEAFARYAGVSPGDYRFALQCRPKNGEWKSVATPLRIVVEPTWWQTVYAQMLFVVGLIVCGFFIGYVRIRRLTAYQSKLQRLVDEQTEEIKKQRDLMALQATTDELTGLPNRRKCTESLQSELARSRRSGLPFSVFLFDIDFFKTINDTNGHAAGDEVLHLIARVGRRAVRETDTLGRWGGDEFILLMPETDRERALVVCRRLKASIEREGVTSRNGITIKITISGGIATHTMDISPEPPSGGQIVRAADEALYRAKQSGRSRIIPASA